MLWVMGSSPALGNSFFFEKRVVSDVTIIMFFMICAVYRERHMRQLAMAIRKTRCLEYTIELICLLLVLWLTVLIM